MICCNGDGVVESAKESESRMTQTLRDGEVASENGWDCASVLARANHDRLSCVVAMAIVSSFQVLCGGVEESEMLSSFWFVSVEEVTGTAKLKANVCSFYPSCGVVVCVSVNVTASVKANGQYFSLRYVEVQIESASVTLNETNSWSSCCSLTDSRCDHESCVKDSLQVVEVPVLVWAYS